MIDLQKNGLIERIAEEQANYCSVFGNPKRVLILWALAEGEMSVGAIAEAVGTSLQNVSQHLGLMKSYKILSSRREGQTIYYAIDKDTLAEHCMGVLRRINPNLEITVHYK